MEGIRKFGHDTFASLKIRNYRLYFIGQSISLCGTWMQTVALGWLVLQLTHSGSQLGLVTGIQFVPILLFGAWGGVIVDRFDTRRLLLWTQAVFMGLVGILSFLIFSDMVQLWMLYVFAALFGAIRVIDNPSRQTFVSEMVDSAHLKNAISLNATANNLARAVGPSIAGVLIATTSIAFCFLINALSYAAVILMLVCMDTNELQPSNASRVVRGQLAAGFRYITSTPVIRNTLIMMAVIGTFAYEFQVSLPLLAQQTFNGDASAYAALLATMGIGSVLGGLFAAGRHKVSQHHLLLFALLFGASIVATALMPTLHLAMAGMFFVGAFSINLISLGNTMVQLESVPEMRGRVMALWSVAMIGSTTIGGPLVGWLGQVFGARWGLGVGGVAAILSAAFAASPLLKKDRLVAIPETVQQRADEAVVEIPKL